MFSNQTPNYGLPQWLNDDRPTWLEDMNGAFANIDENLKRVEEMAEEGGVPQEIIDRIVALETSVTNILAQIGNVTITWAESITDAIYKLGQWVDDAVNRITTLETSVTNILTQIGNDSISSIGTSITNAIVNLKSAIDERYTKSETENLLNELINKIYPTGSLKITYTKINPATYIGGQWELIDEGNYLVATTQDIIDEETERYLNAELPNIKGHWEGAAARLMSKITGAFKGTTSISSAASWGGSGGSDHITNTYFDASNGQVNEDGTTYVAQEDSVYKNGGKVQPKSIAIYVWRRIDDTNLNR